MTRVQGLLSSAVCLVLGLGPLLASPLLTTNTNVPRVNMLIHDQQHILDSGQRLDLACEFYMEHFDLFNNPVLWKKVQFDEITPMNIMGNIMEPFVYTERFTVRLIQSPPKYGLLLSVKDITIEDYGNYTCEIRGKESSVLASITHIVYIRAPVEGVYLSNTNMTLQSMSELEYTESVPDPVHCVSIGGFPPPSLKIYIDNTEVSRRFYVQRHSSTSGEVGLKLIKYRSETWTDRFSATAEADNKIMQCVVTVEGVVTSVASAKLLIRYAPVIRCDKTAAQLGDKHVTIRCMVKARPGMDALYWIIDTNGTRVSSGVALNEYRTINIDRGNGVLETQLHISHVLADSFRPYSIVAENVIGQTTHRTQLLTRNKASLHQSVLQIIESDSTIDGHGMMSYRPSYSSSSGHSLRPSFCIASVLGMAYVLGMASVFSMTSMLGMTSIPYMASVVNLPFVGGMVYLLGVAVLLGRAYTLGIHCDLGVTYTNVTNIIFVMFGVVRLDR